MFPTRKLSPAKAGNYLKKAEELYLETLEARRSGRFNLEDRTPPR